MSRRKLLGRIPLYVTEGGGCTTYTLEWPKRLYEAFHGVRLADGRKPIDATKSLALPKRRKL